MRVLTGVWGFGDGTFGIRGGLCLVPILLAAVRFGPHTGRYG